MRSAILIPVALLAAVVSTQPHGAGHHRQFKRETRQFMEDGNVIVEDVVVTTITVTPGFTPSAVVKPQEKIAQPNYQQYHHGAPWWGQHSSSSSSEYTPPVVVQPNPTPTPTPSPVETPVQPPVETTPVASPPPETTESAPTNTGGSGGGSAVGTGAEPGPSNITPSGSEAWTTSPNSMGKSVIGTINYWRNKWHPGAGDFVWDATLATNARLTTVNPNQPEWDDVKKQWVDTNEQGANVMNHHLYAGSNAQCINEGDGTSMNGDLTPFEVAFLGWICEEPNDSIPCGQIPEAGHYSSTGHADIIGGTYTKVGCHYMDATKGGEPGWKGMWTCDFAF